MEAPLLQLFTTAISITPDFTTIDSIPQFIKFLFDLSIAAVGLAILIQFVRAGLKILLAAGNASKIGEGNTMMTNAIVGAIILFSSVLLLSIINPDLANNGLSKNFQRALSAGNYTTEDIRSEIAHDKAVELLEANGIAVASGVSLEGVRMATLQYLIHTFNQCKNYTYALFGNCNDWTVTRGTNYGGQAWGGGSSKELYANGYVLGIDGDKDLDDYLNANPHKFTKHEGIGIGGFPWWSDKSNTSSFVQFGLDDFEVAVQ